MTDDRLRRLGIDPDGDPIDMMAALERIAAEIRQRREAEPVPVLVDSR